MAGGDYGGYAFRNGIRVKERSDVTLDPEGTQTDPAMWGGHDPNRSGEFYNVILGDGPLFVGLYQQAYIGIHRLNEILPILGLKSEWPKGAVTERAGGGYRWLNPEFFLERNEPCCVEVDGCKVTVRWLKEDNYYLYVQLEQPDGAVWHGFSGFGVGAGFDEDDSISRFSTEERVQTLNTLFPGAVKA